MPLCLSSMLSHTACPTRWVEIAKTFSLYLSSRAFLPLQYFSSALSTSKWSPQQASSSPSYPNSTAFLHNVSKGRSAHCPVNKVTGRDMVRRINVIDLNLRH